MRTSLIIAAAVASLAAPAMAQSLSPQQTYGSIGYTQLEADDATVGAVTGRVGGKFSQYFGAELEGSVGVKDDTFTVAGVDGSVEHKFDVAGYLTAGVPVSPNLELFGRVGYGTTRLRAEIGGLSESASTESVNYGAGANYFFDGQNGVRADWTRRDFVGDNGGEADAYSLSYVRRF